MKTVIEMARSVGARPQQNKNCDVEYLMSTEALEAFAELVRADEREKWARVCDEIDKDSQSQWPKRLATMLRARSNT